LPKIIQDQTSPRYFKKKPKILARKSNLNYLERSCSRFGLGKCEY